LRLILSAGGVGGGDGGTDCRKSFVLSAGDAVSVSVAVPSRPQKPLTCVTSRLVRLCDIEIHQRKLDRRLRETPNLLANNEGRLTHCCMCCFRPRCFIFFRSPHQGHAPSFLAGPGGGKLTGGAFFRAFGLAAAMRRSPGPLPRAIAYQQSRTFLEKLFLYGPSFKSSKVFIDQISHP